MNLRSPKGIPIMPIIMIDTNTSNTVKFDLVMVKLLANNILQKHYA